MIEVLKNKKGLSYRARIYGTDGRLVSATFSRKEDAKTWERRKLYERDQIEATGNAPQGEALFSKFAEDWFSQKVTPRLSLSTQAGYRGDLTNHILPVIGNVKLRELSQEHGHAIVARMRENGNSPKTINGAIGLLQGILNDAVKWQKLGRNPLFGFGTLKQDPQPDRFWTPSEVEQFLRANLASPYYPLFLVAVNTGMRRGELAGLKWDRVRFNSDKAAIIEVTRGMSRYGLSERTKTAKKRIIPVNLIVKSALQRLLKAQRSEFVFFEPDGAPLDVNHVYRCFQEAQARAGMTNRIRFHDLRHTFASNYMMNGGNLYDLQKLLGHTSIKMTERYAHLAPEHLERTVGIVEFGGKQAGETSEMAVKLTVG